MTDWWVPYLGREFSAEWDCWTLVRTVLREQFGIEAPRHGGINPSMPGTVSDAVAEEKSRGRWISIELNNEKPGDVCSFRIAGQEAHVGIVIFLGHVLHVSSTHLTRVDQIGTFARRLAGIWRHPALAE